MNTAIASTHMTAPGQVLRWFANLFSGVRWGLEMRRRYDSERAAGRPVDAAAMRRMAAEVDAWIGRTS